MSTPGTVPYNKTRQTRGRQTSNNPSRSGAKRNSDRLMNDGVFGNSRFTHVVYSLVGCVVQVQVRNGCKYEGVFKTISPQMDVVLEMAHKVEDTPNSSQNTIASIPSRERLIEKLIFNKNDVVCVTALSVDLEYAVKDSSFTDAAISRYNGQSCDRDLRQLQPWEAEGGTEINLTEGESSSNGWDPNDMFKTNEKQFSVRSTYDENLPQYTTPLEKRDTKEYKQREEEATRLAREIEKSDDYKQRIELENGDGDEETKFSAVVRPTDGRGPTGNGSGKYIPPHGRHGQNMPRRVAQEIGGVGPVRQNVPHKQQHYAHHTPNAPVPPPVSTPAVMKEEDVANVNGEKEVKQNESALNKASPELSLAQQQPSSVPQQSGLGTGPVENKTEMAAPPTSNTTSATKMGGRNTKIEELKKFQEKFKMTVPEKPEERRSEEESKDAEPKKIAENSVLNPMAKEFVPKPFVTKPVAQTPTPPRPQTQSPIVQQPIVPIPQMYQSHTGPILLPIGPPQMQSSQGNRYPKRAVVSVQPRADFTAAAQHATGQPLLAAQATPQQYVQYTVMPHVLPQGTPTGYQMMSMATNPGRMVNPASVPMGSSSHPGGIDPSQGVGQPGPSAQAIFMTSHAPVPAHINPHHPGQQMSHPQPAHIGPHPANPQSQGGQMTPVSGPHPAPSPVQHAGPGGQQHHPPQGPPTPGTPQPINYPQMGLQGHPQLQPGSHNPASPQGMHSVSVPYALTSHTHIQGAPQFTFTQAQQPTSVSHTMHTHTHSPHVHQHQLVMMPPPQSQVQHTHVQPHHQFQPGHPMGLPSGFHIQNLRGSSPDLQRGPAPVHGQGPHMMHHSGVPTAIPVSAPSGVHHSQVHYVPQVPSQGAPVQAYQQGQ